MSVVRGFGLNGKSIYMNVCRPQQVSLQFTVTPTNGLGITSLKSNGYVENVFMHTSTTPSANNGFTNPNPLAGYGIVQLKQNFYKFLGLAGSSLNPPNVTATKIDNSALTVGQVYVISTLGNATAANWTQLGVPAGVTPAVGVAFTALVIGVTGEANTSTSRVMLPSFSTASGIEIVGAPDLDQPANVATNAGQQIFFQFVTPSALATPAAGTIVSMHLLFDGSSVTIDGL